MWWEKKEIILKIGIDKENGRKLSEGRREERINNKEGEEEKKVEKIEIGLNIIDRESWKEGLNRRFGEGRRNEKDEEMIERRGNDIIREEGRSIEGIGEGGEIWRILEGKRRDGEKWGKINLIVDESWEEVKREEENIGEEEKIIEMIGKIRKESEDNGIRERGERLIRNDLRIWIGKRNNKRILGNMIKKLGIEKERRRKKEE